MIKALSIQQPWAWLIANGYKDIENRSWQSKQRGWVLIHAGKKIDKGAIEDITDFMPTIPLPTEFDTGGIVGKMFIEDWVDQSESEWWMGPYGAVITQAKPCPLKPVKGQLGFFGVPRELLISTTAGEVQT